MAGRLRANLPAMWSRVEWERQLDLLGDDAAVGARDVLNKIPEPGRAYLGSGRSVEQELELVADVALRGVLAVQGRCDLRPLIRALTALQAERFHQAARAELDERRAQALADEEIAAEIAEDERRAQALDREPGE